MAYKELGYLVGSMEVVLVRREMGQELVDTGLGSVYNGQGMVDKGQEMVDKGQVMVDKGQELVDKGLGKDDMALV